MVKRFFPPAAPCHYKLQFFYVTSFLLSVCFDGRGFGCLAMGCGSMCSPADCSWNQLSNSFSASLLLHSLLTASWCSATCDRSYLTWAHLLEADVVSTAASPFSTSLWVESSATRVDGTDPSRGVGQPWLSDKCEILSENSPLLIDSLRLRLFNP